jgi:hypothetical protein
MRNTVIAIIVGLVAACLGIAAAAGVSFVGQRVIANRAGMQPGFNRYQWNHSGDQYRNQPGYPGMMPGNPGMMPGNPGMMPGYPGTMPGNPGMMPRRYYQGDQRQMPWYGPNSRNPNQPGNPGMMPWSNNQRGPRNGTQNQSPTPVPGPTQAPTLPTS